MCKESISGCIPWGIKCRNATGGTGSLFILLSTNQSQLWYVRNKKDYSTSKYNISISYPCMRNLFHTAYTFCIIFPCCSTFWTWCLFVKSFAKDKSELFSFTQKLSYIIASNILENVKWILKMNSPRKMQFDNFRCTPTCGFDICRSPHWVNSH